MSKCPECKADIKYLDNYQSGKTGYKMDAEGDYDFVGFEPDCEVNDWDCPECTKTLFTDEQEAIDFLKGGKQE